MNTPKATGYLRTIERASGPVYYAQVRLPDGGRLQRRLGRAWTTRSRPPRATSPRPGRGQACRDAHRPGPRCGREADRRRVLRAGVCRVARATSSMTASAGGPRSATTATSRAHYLIPAVRRRHPAGGDHHRRSIGPLTASGSCRGQAVGPDDQQALVLLHGVFKRAERRYGTCATQPGGQRRSASPSAAPATSTSCDPTRCCQLAAAAADRAGRRDVHRRRLHRPAARRAARAALGRRRLQRSGSCTSAGRACAAQTDGAEVGHASARCR